jgi:2-isopropylmalate synthase
MDRVVLYDTTLRDGSQRAGISYTVADKIKIARRLDEFGIPYIEGGWPGSNPKDEEFFRAIRDLPLRQAKVVAFSSTRKAGVACEQDAILRQLAAAGTETVCLFGKSWDFHVTDGLGTTLAENLRMIRESVAWLRSIGRDVIYDAEHFFDGFKANPDYALQTLRAAEEGGASWVVLCDTNGGTLPTELGGVVRHVKERFRTPLGIHTHDDSGVGVANSVVAVEMGARMVQGTINGYGERCGNANLVAVIPNLELKLGLRCLPDGALAGLHSLSHYVSEVANLPPLDAQPFVGRNAFAHKAGVHVSALLKSPRMYEHIEPSAVGNERHVLVSELSGRSNLVHRFGSEIADRDRVERLKKLEFAGYQFEEAEASLELILRGAKPHFELEGLRVVTEKRPNGYPPCEATIKVKVGDRLIHTAAEGNGPVNALDAALRKALTEAFPSVEVVRLTDYKVRVLQGSDGTAAQVRVLIESTDGVSTWGTVGVSTNILEASWQALVDSYEYHLAKVEAARLGVTDS